MLGPEVFARTLSETSRRDSFGNKWQYHSRSDHHSKVACVVILLDLLENCAALAAHARAGKIAFGINHEMRDFTHNRKKNLDLVVCTPVTGNDMRGETLLEQAARWDVQFSVSERSRIGSLPALRRAPVGNVLMALEAKACMTAHQKALPRLYDELNSSQLTVHGSNESAIAVGFVCINAARRYLSPDLNKRVLGSPTWSENPQPKSSEITVAKVKEIPRRSRSKEEGFDAIGIILVDFHNDGTPVRVIDTPPAPGRGDIFHYDTMIERICGSYTTRFREL